MEAPVPPVAPKSSSTAVQLLIVDEMILTLPEYGEIIAPPLAVLNPFRSVTPVIVRDEAPVTLKIPLLDWFPSMNVFAWLPLDAMLMFFETSMLFSKYVPGLRRIVSPGCTPGRLMVALITPVPGLIGHDVAAAGATTRKSAAIKNDTRTRLYFFQPIFTSNTV